MSACMCVCVSACVYMCVGGVHAFVRSFQPTATSPVCSAELATCFLSETDGDHPGADSKHLCVHLDSSPRDSLTPADHCFWVTGLAGHVRE